MVAVRAVKYHLRSAGIDSDELLAIWRTPPSDHLAECSGFRLYLETPTGSRASRAATLRNRGGLGAAACRWLVQILSSDGDKTVTRAYAALPLHVLPSFNPERDAR